MEVVSPNEKNPREIWFNCGIFILYYIMIELLDKDKLVVFKNDASPVMNDCSLGRYKLK